jgi:hypothetical protein
MTETAGTTGEDQLATWAAAWANRLAMLKIQSIPMPLLRVVGDMWFLLVAREESMDSPASGARRLILYSEKAIDEKFSWHVQKCICFEGIEALGYYGLRRMVSGNNFSIIVIPILLDVVPMSLGHAPRLLRLRASFPAYPNDSTEHVSASFPNILVTAALLWNVCATESGSCFYPTLHAYATGR